MKKYSVEELLMQFYLSNYNLSYLHKFINPKYNVEFDNYQTWNQCDIDLAKSKTEMTLEYCQSQSISIVRYYDDQYPAALQKIKYFPPLLFFKGKLPTGRSAAVVGSRNISSNAQKGVETIIEECRKYNIQVISGLASGIDTLAHMAALKNNIYTAAVVPVSLDRIYPPENKHLSEKILEAGGAIISELPLSISITGKAFVLRNRIQAALSDYIIPVEMNAKSGTAYTIKYGYQFQKILLFRQPSQKEINTSLSFLTGIIQSIQYYKKKNNVKIVVIADWKDTSLAFQNVMQPRQQYLF